MIRPTGKSLLKTAAGTASAFVAALLCLTEAALAQPRGAVLVPPDAAVMLRSGSKCLDINEPQVRTNGGRVQLWDCDGRSSQLWRFERGRVVSLATNRCLDVHGPDAGSNGARIQVSDCHGGPNQAWRYDRGLLIAQVDGRCLDVHDPDVDRNGAHVQTWDCRESGNQRWRIEPVAPVQVTRDVEAGPLWNNGDAERKCPALCAPAKWTGQWRTTVQGRMSVCNCTSDVLPGPRGAVPDQVMGAGPRPMRDARFEELLQVMKSEAFPQGKLRVVEDASRDNYFVIAQLRRVIEGLTFPSDKTRAVEIMAPRIVDRQNAFTLYSVFDFDSEKEQARAIFDRLK
jgi:hypothetical protein